ncbi:MAG: dihydropteroate synthase [Clostridia bacterium]|nr:dihydropteroate synthase [Clostridia bacterium]
MLFEGKRFRFEPGNRTYIMGVLNVTPDSFSDGGVYADAQAAVDRALQMQAEGADIVDVGAESTAPGSTSITPQEEIARLRPVLGQLCALLQVPVSVDTRHPETAAWALENGAAIINDVSGVFLPQMAEAVRQYEAGWIVMHGKDADADGTDDPLPQIRAFFAEMQQKAQQAGVRKTQLCMDPGIGFGKSRAGDLQVLRGLRHLKTDCALLVGASRKRVIGAVSGEGDPLRRLPGTVACHTIAVSGGADILRVHDVAESVQAARVADAVLRIPQARRKGKILLRDLRVFAYHGVNPEEKEYGQTFLVDADMTVDLAPAIAGDDIAETVSYAQVAKTLQRTLTETRYDLIETAADAAARALFCAYPAILRLRLRLKKPDAPMKAQCAWAAVEIERERDK